MGKSKKNHGKEDQETENGFSDNDEPEDYKKTLRKLQIELVKLQKHIIANDIRVVVVVEGRDGAGKDGTIKRITEHLSPRETRVVALSKPSDKEVTQWYFQRYSAYLPSADEFVFFNRSWYNRAGVEIVMGFCTKKQLEGFFAMVIPFEEMLVRSGIVVVKYYLDISRAEQEKRLEARRKDPLKQWKISPIDAAALSHWDDYSKARNEMLLRTSHKAAPWTIVDANDKAVCRLNVIRDLLGRIDYADRDKSLSGADPSIVAEFSPDHLVNGRLAL